MSARRRPRPATNRRLRASAVARHLRERQLVRWNLLYSFVSFYGVLEIAVCGKAVCTHDPSKKDSLSDTLSNAAARESGIGGLERRKGGKCAARAEGSEDGSSSSEDGSEEG